MSKKRKKGQEGLRKWQVALDGFLHKSVASNIGYLVFYCFLAVLYITNNNKATLMNRELNEQHQTLKELKWKHTDLQSQVMNQTSETELIKLSEGIGLLPLEYPVFEIRVKPEDQNQEN